jgi:Lon protease-like protein
MVREGIPIFPLSTVLFPRMALPLRVFEPRYLAMVARCIRERTGFGVALIREGEEVGGGAVPEVIGTMARIRAVQHDDEGDALTLLAMGTERYRLLDYTTGPDDYLIGTTSLYRDTPQDTDVVGPLASDARRLFGHYFASLVSRAGIDLPEYDLPHNPSDLSFVIAAVIQQEAARRQAMLEARDTAQRLAQEIEMLQDSIERLNAMPEASEQILRYDTRHARELTSRN